MPGPVPSAWRTTLRAWGIIGGAAVIAITGVIAAHTWRARHRGPTRRGRTLGATEKRLPSAGELWAMSYRDREAFHKQQALDERMGIRYYKDPPRREEGMTDADYAKVVAAHRAVQEAEFHDRQAEREYERVKRQYAEMWEEYQINKGAFELARGQHEDAQRRLVKARARLKGERLAEREKELTEEVAGAARRMERAARDVAAYQEVVDFDPVPYVETWKKARAKLVDALAAQATADYDVYSKINPDDAGDPGFEWEDVEDNYTEVPVAFEYPERYDDNDEDGGDDADEDEDD